MEKTIGIIYAPIEIENPGQLETLGITWKDVFPLKVGKRTVSVYLVPASEEVSRYMLQELHNKYKTDLRSRRCMVKGASGKLVSCPACNSCEDCPVQDLAGRRPRVCSLDAIVEDGWDSESCDSSLQKKAELGEMFSVIRESDPKIFEILSLKLAGYTEREISESLGISAPAVHRAIVKARRIAEEYMDLN
jgi:DNA-directed RNA polymerase specialized sigma24 family protein